MFHVEHNRSRTMVQAPMFHVEHVEAQDPLAMFYAEHSNPALRPWRPGSKQLPCHLTHTTPESHAIIRENLHRSSMYNGAITATGVRYCPSIEDKIVLIMKLSVASVGNLLKLAS